MVARCVPRSSGSEWTLKQRRFYPPHPVQERAGGGHKATACLRAVAPHCSIRSRRVLRNCAHGGTERLPPAVTEKGGEQLLCINRGRRRRACRVVQIGGRPVNEQERPRASMWPPYARAQVGAWPEVQGQRQAPIQREKGEISPRV